MYLANVIAVAALQYYSRLDFAWRSAEIYFYNVEDSRSDSRALGILSPHVNIKVKNPCHSACECWGKLESCEEKTSLTVQQGKTR